MNSASPPSGRRSAGSGIGLELTEHAVRGVRIDELSVGHVAATAEFALRPTDDDRLIDALVLMNAALGESSAPTRIATFPPGATLQRIDVTASSDADLVDIAERMHTDHGIRSSTVAADGPRRWLLLIRWNETWIERVRAMATRAGLVDVVVEPSAMAIGRVAGVDATYVRRIASQQDTHEVVLRHRVPVAAMVNRTSGRSLDIEIARGPVPLTAFDEYLDDNRLGESIERAATRAGDALRPDVGDLDSIITLDTGSIGRQVVAFGAAIGAAGLIGPIHPIRVTGPRAGLDGDPFDRPWAIEAVPASDQGSHADAVHGFERVTRWFRARRAK